MPREFLIACYLLAFRCVFNLFKLLPQKNKVTFVVTFQKNASYIHQEMIKQNVQVEIVFLCKPSIANDLQKKHKDTTVIPFETPNLLYWCLSVYHLSTSKIIIIDNYFGFLSAINFKGNVECIQIWHAAGALKTFGLKDKTIVNRTETAQRRFRRVYEKFHKIVVGSEEMANIFSEAFDLRPQNILRTGIPRTDFFYEDQLLEKAKSSFLKKFPSFTGKKVILYAPTYRDHQLSQNEIHFDLEKMYQALKHEYILVIKLHPAMKTTHHYHELYPGFVYDFSFYKSINNLLVVTDVLITDYSSIPFEFAVLKKPMIFFPYDLEWYQKERGVLRDYIREVPGPVVFETDAIIKVILDHEFNPNLIREFSNKWNTYSDGNSSKKLVDYMVNRIKQGG
jgi:teichoic acid glycerol-phosphate primase